MDVLVLLLIQVAFFVAIVTAFFLGRKTASFKPTTAVDKEEVKKAKQNRKDFMNMMNYDVETATARKKVT